MKYLLFVEKIGVSVERKAAGVSGLLVVYLCPAVQVLKQLTDFYRVWYVLKPVTRRYALLVPHGIFC
jgi:hypothetical protein